MLHVSAFRTALSNQTFEAYDKCAREIATRPRGTSYQTLTAITRPRQPITSYATGSILLTEKHRRITTADGYGISYEAVRAPEGRACINMQYLPSVMDDSCIEAWGSGPLQVSVQEM